MSTIVCISYRTPIGTRLPAAHVCPLEQNRARKKAACSTFYRINLVRLTRHTDMKRRGAGGKVTAWRVTDHLALICQRADRAAHRPLIHPFFYGHTRRLSFVRVENGGCAH